MARFFVLAILLKNLYIYCKLQIISECVESHQIQLEDFSLRIYNRAAELSRNGGRRQNIFWKISEGGSEKATNYWLEMTLVQPSPLALALQNTHKLLNKRQHLSSSIKDRNDRRTRNAGNGKI